MEEKEKTPTDYFKGVKVPIKHIVKYDNSIKTLSETAIKAIK